MMLHLHQKALLLDPVQLMQPDFVVHCTFCRALAPHVSQNLWSCLPVALKQLQ